MVEVKNAVMAQMLNAIGDKDQSDWDLMLPFCMMAYNSTEHAATTECPSKVHLGRLLNTPLDVMTSPHEEFQRTYATDYVRKLEGQIQRTYTTIREHLGKASQRNKRYYDRKHHLNCFKRGDLVLMKTMVKQVGKSPKIMDRYEGPFVVIDKISDLTYRIKENVHKRAKIIHHDRLKPYVPREPEENDTEWLDSLERPVPIELPTTLVDPSTELPHTQQDIANDNDNDAIAPTQDINEQDATGPPPRSASPEIDAPNNIPYSDSLPQSPYDSPVRDNPLDISDPIDTDPTNISTSHSDDAPPELTLRRGNRVSRPPDRLGNWIY